MAMMEDEISADSDACDEHRGARPEEHTPSIEVLSCSKVSKFNFSKGSDSIRESIFPRQVSMG